ncbi:minor capsid protein [bacterium]|nr:minor capsid protein [bacterium]
MRLAELFGLTPQRALEFFQNKNNKEQKEWWSRIWQEQHEKAFTVAQTLKRDVLKEIRAEVQKAIENGTTLKEFQKNLKPALQKKGWWGKVPDPDNPEKEVQLGSPRRLETIFNVNLRTAYQTGRYQAMTDNAENRPYWQYIAVDDDRTRAEHKQLNGKVFRYDDPFWDTFYPPNGWGCRCTVRALSQKDVDRLGLKVESSAGMLLPGKAQLPNGKTVEGMVYRPRRGMEVSPDIGWAYAPGKSSYQPNYDGSDPQLDEALKRELERGPERII